MGIRFNGHNINLNNIKKVRIDGHTIYQESFNFLCFTAQQAGSTVKWNTVGWIEPNMQISTNGKTWNSWAIGSDYTLTNVGDKVYVKNNSGTLSASSSKYVKFFMTGLIAASGDTTSLINFGNAYDYCFYKLFSGCTALTTAPELPSLTLGNSSYYQMFWGCSGLTKGPDLPATVIGEDCYREMFYNCTQMSEGPTKIDVINIPKYTCSKMFYNCYALKNGPAMTNVTSVGYASCLSMFENCKELITAPNLNATTLDEFCYQIMFRGCAKLKTAPTLKVNTLPGYCYNGMFENCSELNVTQGSGGVYFFQYFTTGSNSVTDMFKGTAGFTSTPETATRYYYNN